MKCENVTTPTDSAGLTVQSKEALVDYRQRLQLERRTRAAYFRKRNYWALLQSSWWLDPCRHHPVLDGGEVANIRRRPLWPQVVARMLDHHCSDPEGLIGAQFGFGVPRPNELLSEKA